jgi:hypothetical protein
VHLTEFSEDPEAAGVAAALGRELLLYRTRAQIRFTEEATVSALELLADPVPREAQRPPEGLDAIYGSGLIDVGGYIAPVLLVDERAAAVHAGELLRLSDHPGLSHVVQPLRGNDGRDVFLFPIPEPLPYFGTAERVNGPGTLGTLGAVVTDGQNRRLITTAGHVAPTGAHVTDSAGASGTVMWSHNPAASAGPAPAADIALIAVHGSAMGAGTVAITGKGGSHPGDHVEVYGSLTALGTSQTMGFVAQLFVPSMAGMWADLYFTTTAASVQGDSGAPVLAAGSNSIVGHIVGGAPGLTSYIQSIDVQLAATGCTFP